MANVQKNSTKYVAMVGNTVVEEFKTMTAAMMWSTNGAIRLEMAQDNDWIRVHEYYPDGTVTETYER